MFFQMCCCFFFLAVLSALFVFLFPGLFLFLLVAALCLPSFSLAFAVPDCYSLLSAGHHLLCFLSWSTASASCRSLSSSSSHLPSSVYTVFVGLLLLGPFSPNAPFSSLLAAAAWSSSWGFSVFLPAGCSVLLFSWFWLGFCGGGRRCQIISCEYIYVYIFVC